MDNIRPRRPQSVRKPVALKAWPPKLTGTAMRPCQRSVSATSSSPSAAGAGTNQVACARAPRGAWDPASGMPLPAAPAAGAATGAALVDSACCTGSEGADCLRAARAAHAITGCCPTGPLAGARARAGGRAAVILSPVAAPSARPSAVAAVAPDAALCPGEPWAAAPSPVTCSEALGVLAAGSLPCERS